MRVGSGKGDPSRSLRFTRRLLFAVAWLAVVDLFVPPVLARIERDWYEGHRVFRFENSDLFALGPLVAYLREHPRGERPRVAFFGNSVIWGYGLRTSSTVPARFQERQPGVRVLNVAVNGFELGDAYLITKAIVSSVDRLYVQVAPGSAANPALASLIPVEETDARAFELRSPSRLERRLEEVTGTWRLYGAAYRLQAALFGTSTRQYIYLNKGTVVRRLLAWEGDAPREARPTEADPQIELAAPVAAAPPTPERRAQLRVRYPVLWQFEELVQRHQKQTVFLEFREGVGPGRGLSDDEIADLNATFRSFGQIVRLRIPTALKYDAIHLTEIGAHRVAEALAHHLPHSIAELR